MFLPGGVTELDGYSVERSRAATYGRCTDGTGPMTWTQSAHPRRRQRLPAGHGAGVAGQLRPSRSATSSACFGTNVSGLAYQPSGTSAPGVLWVAQNNPSTLYRMVHDGTKWVRDTANGWGMGKQLTFADGAGVPDAEGITLTGDGQQVYVSIERNDDGPNSITSRPSVLRFDVSAPGHAAEGDQRVEPRRRHRPAGRQRGPGVDHLGAGLGARGQGLPRRAAGKAYNPADYAGTAPACSWSPPSRTTPRSSSTR